VWKCTGMNTREWGFDAVFDVECPSCGQGVEFFKDEITRYCPSCHALVTNPRKDYGCNQWCSASGPQPRNMCDKFRRSKDRFRRDI